MADDDLGARLVGLQVDLAELRAEVAALDRLVHAMFTARDQALGEVATQTRRAQAQANEWRGALNDLSATKLAVATFEQYQQTLDQRIGDLQTAVSTAQGARGGADRTYLFAAAFVAGVVGVVGLVVSIVTALR